MHKESCSALHSGPTATLTTPTSSSPLKSQLHPSDVVHTSLYSQIFSPKQVVAGSLFFAPCEDEESNSASAVAAMKNHIHHNRFVQEHQDIVNRHSLCLTHLREASEEAEALRRENTHLRNVNRELNKHLSVLVQSSIQKQFSPDSMPFNILDSFRGLHMGEKGASSSSWEELSSDESPTSVMESGSIENVEVERFSLPKSISVRSTGYLKMNQAGTTNGGRARNSPRARTASPLKAAKKVYVHAGKKEEEPLELEVYNQGMFKTELCNKWQETGACPYGDHCQFAHGIEELRPVIRHPRYKTEVCRMVLAGVVCPYGHRCHFRHALTEQERVVGALKPAGTVKLER